MADSIITYAGYKLPATDANLEELLDRIVEGPVRFISIAHDFGAPDEARMVMEYIPDVGFHVHALGRGDRSDHIPAEPGASAEVIVVPIGGNDKELPSRLLIRIETARRVARAFLPSGVRTSEVEWVDVDTIWIW